ncbi:MAG: thiamine pyrophosphate-binding protein, partial [Pseudomonadota bacterium]
MARKTEDTKRKMTPLASRGADYVISFLKAQGVDVIFSLSGNQIMPLYDACIEHKMRIIHTCHEAATVYMADAYAQATGRVGVALVTAGPGVAHTVSALYSAKMNESPVILLSGDSPTHQDGKGAFQEMDQCAITIPIAKISLRATTTKVLIEILPHVWHVCASGRLGPVHIALPFDILQTEQDFPTPQKIVRDAQGDDHALSPVLTQFMEARCPLILCGPHMNATRT